MTQTGPQQRLIVPDLARGLALLGIATANVAQAWIINGDNTAPGHTLGGIRPGSGLDQFLAVVSAMFVHVRGLPMFSTLLGFGIGLIAASLYRKGYPLKKARGIIARRYAFLGLFGLIHLFAVFYGDIMLTYGLIGLVMALVFPIGSNALRAIAYTVLILFAIETAFSALAAHFLDLDLGGISLDVTTAELTSLGSYVSANVDAAVDMAVSEPFAVAQLGGLSIIGYVWAREGYLVNVNTHRRILWTWVGIAAAIVLLVGLPWGLAAIGAIDPSWEDTLMIINSGVGVFTGPGILAFFALITNNLKENPRWAYPFVALGKRSMSGYLAQSFLFILLVMPFGFRLGTEASISGKLGIALLVWLITLGLATILEATNTQGPFEWVHRRLSYGPSGKIAPYEVKHEHV